MDTCTRPKTRKSFTKKLREEIYKRDSGKCRHCNTRVQKNNSHLDHHPIPHRDIINNIFANRFWQRMCLCCSFGRYRIIIDPMDRDNIKLSCPSCNISHQYEPDGRCLCCGHTQPYCYRPNFYLILVLIVIFILGFVSGIFVNIT